MFGKKSKSFLGTNPKMFVPERPSTSEAYRIITLGNGLKTLLARVNKSKVQGHPIYNFVYIYISYKVRADILQSGAP